MPYDEDLANRIRELLADQPAVTEQRMFGGLAFMVGGNLAIAASREGGILVRVGPEDADRLQATTSAQLAIMGERTMRGWLRVAADDVRTKRQLGSWVQRAVRFTGSLPAKRAKATR